MNAKKNPAYPKAIATLETAWLNVRRKAVGEADGSRERVGVGLSGGGIRSATICLGVFQGLARHKLLQRVDYISSVSGGGYFASFFGRLFDRDNASGNNRNNAADVEDLLAANPDSRPVRNVRDFGRYIAPNGAGDIINTLAVLLRNWLTIHVVLGILILALFVLCISVRIALAHVFPHWSGAPFAWLLAFFALAWSIPCGWAYWIPPKARTGIKWPTWGLLAVVALAGMAMATWKWRGAPPGSGNFLVWTLPSVVALLTALAHGLGRGAAGPAPSFSVLQATYRNSLSRWLGNSLVAMASVLALALAEGAGRWVHLTAVSTGGWPWSLAGLGTALPAAFALIQRAKLALDKLPANVANNSGKKLALVASAVGLWAIVLLGWSSLAHLLACRIPTGGSFTFQWGSVLGMMPNPAVLPSPWPPLGLLLLLGLMAWITGAHRGFVNFSSQHSLYSARLTRAYLGASNPNRDGVPKQPPTPPDLGAATPNADTIKTHPLTESDPGDDISMAEHWGWNQKNIEDRPCSRGAPIHLINATINETVDGRSSIQQLDRKGTSIAIGPCALSVGVSHHAAPEPPDDQSRSDRPPEQFRCVAPEGDAYKVFERPPGEPCFKPERLSLGQWTAISGAAFSTGIGSQTTLFMSLLTGFANVRLGYWWYSGVQVPRLLKGCFEVQRKLINEFVARFPGTARREWYLSDGGHFDNLGAYELLRRRLKRIVLIDAEADPDYTYGGLLLLIRKARIDFGVSIRFLKADELDGKLDPACRALFGTLEDLRRPAGHQDVSKAHAAFAVVEYPDETNGEILYIKSTLTGDEEPDVLDYHARHPDFPHQATADQFFDEAQWESHRAVGLHIGDQLFRPRARHSDRWQPADLFHVSRNPPPY